MYFSSKKDIPFSLTFGVFTLTIILLNVFRIKSFGWAFIVSGLFLGLLIWIWFGTGYKIAEGKIKITSGPFRSVVKIKDIKKLSTTHLPFWESNPLSGPGLSVDQLEITHGKDLSVINISPKDEQDFVKILITKNPYIQIDKKLSGYTEKARKSQPHNILS